eukprot:CAMPEP_0172859696 /NCGR_PEP_ID=MMETSP1075-20121228/70925_1 /TAXON_ID=2916 /ORGANISM="Ceratium fusus, Strain PA161109" /LENGTH=568 /DNA_ID=CAMNT_0013707579 /DNA_START=1 /DNA_END=1707 /DNA_ORIENTATION=+
MAVTNEHLSDLASQWASIAIGSAVSAADNAALAAASNEGSTQRCGNRAGIECSDNGLSPNLDSLSPITEEGRITESIYGKTWPVDTVLEQDGRVMPQFRSQAEHIEGKMAGLMKEVGLLCSSFEREVGALKQFEQYQKKHCKAVAALVSEELRGFFDQEFLKLRSHQEHQFTALSMMVCDMLDADVSTVRDAARETNIHSKLVQSALNKANFYGTTAREEAQEMRRMRMWSSNGGGDISPATSGWPGSGLVSPTNVLGRPGLVPPCSAKEQVASLAAQVPVPRALSTGSRTSQQQGVSSRASDTGSGLMSPVSVARGSSACAAAAKPFIEMGTGATQSRVARCLSPGNATRGSLPCGVTAKPCIETGTGAFQSHSARGLSEWMPTARVAPTEKSASILNSFNAARIARSRASSLSGSLMVPLGNSVTLPVEEPVEQPGAARPVSVPLSNSITLPLEEPVNQLSAARTALSPSIRCPMREGDDMSAGASTRPAGAGSQPLAIRGSASVPYNKPSRLSLPRRASAWVSPSDLAKPSGNAALNGANSNVRSSSPGIPGPEHVPPFRKTIDV